MGSGYCTSPKGGTHLKITFFAVSGLSFAKFGLQYMKEFTPRDPVILTPPLEW